MAPTTGMANGEAAWKGAITRRVSEGVHCSAAWASVDMEDDDASEAARDADACTPSDDEGIERVAHDACTGSTCIAISPKNTTRVRKTALSVDRVFAGSTPSGYLRHLVVSASPRLAGTATYDLAS